MRLTAYLNHIDGLVATLEGELVVVDFNTFNAIDTDKWALVKQVASSLAHDTCVTQQDLL